MRQQRERILADIEDKLIFSDPDMWDEFAAIIALMDVDRG